MTEEIPQRPKQARSETEAELRRLIEDWRADADKIQQTVGVEPTTLIRCAEDLEGILDDPPEQ
jgi:hypothetical protein